MYDGLRFIGTRMTPPQPAANENQDSPIAAMLSELKNAVEMQSASIQELVNTLKKANA